MGPFCTILFHMRSKQRSPDFPLPGHFFQLFRSDPKSFSLPRASSQWDINSTPPQKGTLEASDTDAQATSFQCREAATLFWVNQDSPTRSLRYSGQISSTPYAWPTRSFWTTLVTSVIDGWVPSLCFHYWRHDSGTEENSHLRSTAPWQGFLQGWPIVILHGLLSFCFWNCPATLTQLNYWVSSQGTFQMFKVQMTTFLYQQLGQLPPNPQYTVPIWSFLWWGQEMLLFQLCPVKTWQWSGHQVLVCKPQLLTWLLCGWEGRVSKEHTGKRGCEVLGKEMIWSLTVLGQNAGRQAGRMTEKFQFSCVFISHLDIEYKIVIITFDVDQAAALKWMDNDL